MDLYCQTSHPNMEQAQWLCTLIVCLYANGCSITSATVRPNAIVSGPTVVPDFVRLEGEILEKCPEAFPYPFDNGKKCCRSVMKENDTSLASDCDGEKLMHGSSSQCCWKDMFAYCTDQIKGCNINIKTCYPNPTLYYNDEPYGSRYDDYGPAWAFEFHQCEVSYAYYIANDYVNNHVTIIDFGCEASVKEFVFRNTRNTYHNNRGTKNFTVEMSYDLSAWTTVINEIMPTAIGINECEIPLLTYPVPAHGRYFRFTAIDYYGIGSGLNYLTWNFLV